MDEDRFVTGPNVLCLYGTISYHSVLGAARVVGNGPGQTPNTEQLASSIPSRYTGPPTLTINAYGDYLSWSMWLKNWLSNRLFVALKFEIQIEKCKYLFALHKYVVFCV